MVYDLYTNITSLTTFDKPDVVGMQNREILHMLRMICIFFFPRYCHIQKCQNGIGEKAQTRQKTMIDDRRPRHIWQILKTMLHDTALVLHKVKTPNLE